MYVCSSQIAQSTLPYLFDSLRSDQDGREGAAKRSVFENPPGLFGLTFPYHPLQTRQDQVSHPERMAVGLPATGPDLRHVRQEGSVAVQP